MSYHGSPATFWSSKGLGSPRGIFQNDVNKTGQSCFKQKFFMQSEDQKRS